MPIQPRSDLCPDRETVFQVTNKGYDSVIDTRDAYEGREPTLDVALDVVNRDLDELADRTEGEEADEDRDDDDDDGVLDA